MLGQDQPIMAMTYQLNLKCRMWSILHMKTRSIPESETTNGWNWKV